MQKENFRIATYQRIAADIASKVVEEHYKVGEKIHARSTLATYYNVSSETARRAVSVLTEMNVCEAIPGSGVIIKSKENAIEFIKQFQDIKTVEQLKREIVGLVDKQIEEDKKLKKNILNLMDKVNRFKSVNPFVPYEIIIKSTCSKLNKSLAEIKFWNNTYATVVGIRRDDNLIMSPGPKHVLMEGDILYFVGSETCQETVRNFLYEQ